MRVLIYDGKQWRQHKGRQRRDGLHVTINGTKTVFTDDLVSYRNIWSSLAVITIEAPQLSDHVALERARQQIALSSIFQSGGDLMRYLQIAAVVIPLISAIYTAVQIGSINDVVSIVTKLTTLIEGSRLIQ
jgi:hypothetical protein